MLCLKHICHARRTLSDGGVTHVFGFTDTPLQGCVYLLSTWYVRYDMGKRYSVFYLLGVVASAFSGILAFGLMQMNGLAGLGGWR